MILALILEKNKNFRIFHKKIHEFFVTIKCFTIIAENALKLVFECCKSLECINKPEKICILCEIDNTPDRFSEEFIKQ